MMKVCGECGFEKSLGDFYDDPRRAGRKRSYCIACHKARHARRRAQPEVKAATKASSARYYVENREEILARNAAYDRANKATRGASRVRARERRLRGVVVEQYDRNSIFARDNWVCQLCQEPINPFLYRLDRMSATIDHIIPLDRGGDDAPHNVQAAHRSCNSSKQASLHWTIFRIPVLLKTPTDQERLPVPDITLRPGTTGLLPG